MKNIILMIIYLSSIMLFFSGCEDKPTENNYQLILSTEADTLYSGTNYASCLVKADLLKNGNPCENAEIDFAASLGTIAANAVTNAEGYAEVLFEFHGSGSGSATIQASFKNAEAELLIQIVDGFPFDMQITSSNDMILIGSEINYCDITINLSQDNEPITNAIVSLSSDLGYIPSEVVTNEQGTAHAVFLYEEYEEGTAVISATYQNMLVQLEIELIIDPALQLSLSSSSNIIYINSNTNYCLIFAELTRNGEPLADKQINFSSTHGNIFNFGFTDEEGIAEVTFWYDGTLATTATITARYKGLVATVNVILSNDSPFNLEVWAEPDTIYLDSGNYYSNVFARLTDIDNIGVADKIITFQASHGFITSSAMTNQDGLAQVQYIFSGDNPMNIIINADYQSLSPMCIIHVIEPEILLSVWAEQDTIYENTNNNYTEIYAQLVFSYGSPITGVQINFSADIGSILGFGHTNSQGIANSTFWYDERPDMIATITASYQSLSANTTVAILTNQPQIVFLEAIPLVIYLDDDTTTYSLIRTRIVDSFGAPAGDVTVTFETNLGYLEWDSTQSGSDGYATTRLHDDGVTGIATVFVYCENDQSQIDVQIVEE